MAYIGNTVENQGFTPAIDYFNGNGVTVTFTLSRPIASVAQVIVAIDNVIQNPSSSFTIAGNAITFSSAPLSGTNNIWVEYTSLITTYQAISQDPTVIGDIRATGGYLAEGDFGNSFVDGVILDYVTGLGRITVGSAEGIALYNGGTTARTALMTVAATGNVGIGTTSPTFATGSGLAVERTGSIATIQVNRSDAATAGSLSLLGGSGINIVYGTGAKPLGFSTDSTERMRIDSSGRVVVGYTASVGTAYQPLMQLKGGGSASNYAAYSLITSNNEQAGLFGVYSNGENSLWIASDQDNLRPGSRIVFSVDAVDQASIASGGNFAFNSGYGSVATAYGCRAWVNFDGTGTVAIRGSGNVSSITDNGTAEYTVNFTTSMPDTNYCTAIYAYEASYYVINAAYGQTKNTGSFAIGGYYTNASSGTWSLTQRDIPQMNVAIFR
jgi:hypothetical protein